MNAQLASSVNALPGDNPVQWGPQEATLAVGGSAPTPLAAPPSGVGLTQTVGPQTTATNPYGNQFHQGQASSSPTTTTLSIQSPPAQTPAVTPSPSSASPSDEQILNTSIYTSNGVVYEVVNIEVIKTTTVDVPAPTPEARRRKRAEHLRRLKEHMHQHH
jgi:hypothetical protein